MIGLHTIDVSSIESKPITVTWKYTVVGWPFFLGGLILSYNFGSSGNMSLNVKLVLKWKKITVSDVKYYLRVPQRLISDLSKLFRFLWPLFCWVLGTHIWYISLRHWYIKEKTNDTVNFLENVAFSHKKSGENPDQNSKRCLMFNK